MKFIPILLLMHFPFAQLAPVGPLETFVAQPPPKRKKFDGPRCQLQFSEFKLGSSLESSPFIELQSICQKRPGTPPKTAIADYTLIITQGNPLYLAMVVSFENFPHDGTMPFVVIGPPDVPNVHISTATPHLQSIFSRTIPNRMLPIPNENSYGVFLLHGLSKAESRNLNLIFNLDGGMSSRRLTTEQLKLISEKAVDMVVLGENGVFKMEQYKYFWPESSTPMFTETWNLVANAGSDMSLSVCNPEYKGFDAGAFMIKQQSPGEKNICENLIIMQELSTPAPTEHHSSITQVNHLHHISQENLDEIRTHVFQQIWVERCQDKFPKKSKMLENESIQKWINFNEDGCRFTCKACKTYLQMGFRPDIKAKPNIVTSGYLSTDIYDNGNSIRNHVPTNLHSEAMEFYERMEHAITENDVQNIITDFEAKELVTFNATMNLILIVYAELKAGLPFQTHETLMSAIRKTGANVGTKHHTDDAPHVIAKVLANSFRQKLLNHLVKEDKPFSIIIDSSTSFNMPFLAVYIQVLEDGYPTIHFYSLVHMAEGEAAAEMSEYFFKQIRNDDQQVPGFENYFKTRIVSYSSDGAAVMVGGKNSFKTYLKTYTGKDVPNIVCLAHKLDSAYKNGIKPAKAVLELLNDDNPIDKIRKWQLSFFETFEGTLNELYTFYSSRGYKKWMHFLKTAEELEINAKRMKYIWNVRWSESHYRALETIHQMLYGLLEDLDRMRKDRSFDQSSRNKADNYYVRMTDKTYLIVLHEFLDILSSFKIASKKLQESSSTLVGKAQIIYGILEEIEDLQRNTGLSVKSFLQNIACVGLCDGGACTISQYDACQEVIINGFRLKNHYDVVMDYTEVRNGLYENIIASIRKYFSLELLESFEIFNPKRLNFHPEIQEIAGDDLENFYLTDSVSEKYQIATTQEARLKYVCQFYSISNEKCSQFKTEWIGVLSCLRTTSDSSLENQGESTKFWPLALTLCVDKWTPVTKEILGYVMVTPYTSSEAERGFSVMNNLKTTARSRMDKTTLDALMTIKINGPNIEDFAVYEYTIEFLKSHSRVDDITMNRGRKPAEEKFPSFFSKSRIY